MFKHQEIWNAIDQIASNSGMSTSGLAKLAGLDATTFNKSKRTNKNGNLRWPSTESISKVLNALKLDFEDFAQLVTGTAPNIRVPLVSWEQAASDNSINDKGFPYGEEWSDLRLPDISENSFYALEVSGDSMEPAFRQGDHVLVAPNEPIKQGDRVIVKTIGGKIMAKTLKHKTKNRVELASINPKYDDISMDQFEILWMARIIWVSQ